MEQSYDVQGRAVGIEPVCNHDTKPVYKGFTRRDLDSAIVSPYACTPIAYVVFANTCTPLSYDAPVAAGCGRTAAVGPLSVTCSSPCSTPAAFAACLISFFRQSVLEISS